VKVAVTGANGQLGTDLCRVLHNFELVPFTHADIEISDLASVREAMVKHRPAVIVNTASYVRVDDCEDEEEKVFAVNARGAGNLAAIAQELGAKLVHMSTDYVFGGEVRQETTPYTELDTPVPISVYGRSKLAGEELVRCLCVRHFIVRVSGLFGTAGSSGKGGNFIETMLRLARERHELRVVSDQIFSPTYAEDAARKIVQLMTTEHYGIFHVTNRGACSWYEFAAEIFRLAGLPTAVIPITSAEYPQKARRPRYSVLDNYRLRVLGLDDMRSWQEALAHYMAARGHTD
jgi:dTDP-4-dehydrorhamnose reductase